MEPYAYAGDDYRINGYLTYELTIPKGAKYFRVNDGVDLTASGRPYRYSTSITKLYTDDTFDNDNYIKREKIFVINYCRAGAEHLTDNVRLRRIRDLICRGNDLGRGVSSHLGRRYNSGGICFRIDFRSNNRSCLYRSN